MNYRGNIRLNKHEPEAKKNVIIYTLYELVRMNRGSLPNFLEQLLFNAYELRIAVICLLEI